MAEGRILTDKDLKSISSDIGKKANQSHVHRDTDIVLESTGDTLEDELMRINTFIDLYNDNITDLEDKKIGFIGQNPAKNIQIISSGGSTSGIAKETLIFELE